MARSSRRGFTLIELLVVVAIVAVLAGLAMGGYSTAREAAWRTECASHLRQVSLAVLLYAADNSQTLPPLTSPSGGWGWTYYLRGASPAYLPPVPPTVPNASALNHWGGAIAGSDPLICPARAAATKTLVVTSYAFNALLFGSDSTPVARLTAVSRPVRTIFMGDCCWWTAKGQPFSNFNSLHLPGTNYQGSPAKRHTNGAGNISFLDGHVEYWPDTTLLAQAKYSNGGADDLWSLMK